MKLIKKLITISTAIIVPLIIIFIGLRLLLTPVFLSIEYQLPGFPQDMYGFSQNERFVYSNIAMDYLLNGSEIDFLASQQFPDGSSLFNSRELSHMEDVKNVVKSSLAIGYLTCILFIILGVLSIRLKLTNLFLKGIRYGGWVILGLIAFIGIFALISFWNFFAVFHSLFFQGDSWIFSYSDTLIRLFPLKFWQDAFLFEGIFAIITSFVILIFTKQRIRPHPQNTMEE